MSETADRKPILLPPAAGGLKAAFARPKVMAAACVVALAALGWLYLGVLVAGMGVLDGLPRAVTLICQPTFGIALMPEGAWGTSGFTLVALMWGAMGFAMMLPSAGPMILTYAEIAETAAGKGERIVSPVLLAAGYAAVWLGFAAVAAVAQFAFTRLALIDDGMASASALFSGAIFIAAGVYQFSALKHACLTQCQRPFPFFFAHWQTSTRGVFRLGLEQGLYCLGCCWAMMAVMFAVGVMNVVWMAALGMVMALEKIGSGNRFTYATGAAMVAVGAAFVLGAFAAHWPLRAI
jgi:predicted metal-binding membrane protein